MTIRLPRVAMLSFVASALTAATASANIVLDVDNATIGISLNSGQAGPLGEITASDGPYIEALQPGPGILAQSCGAQFLICGPSRLTATRIRSAWTGSSQPAERRRIKSM